MSKSNRQATGVVAIDESQITVDLVDEDGCLLIQSICRFNAMPLHYREIPAILGQLALYAHVKISHIVMTDRRLDTLKRKLADEFSVPVTTEDDAGSALAAAAASENEGETYVMVRSGNNIWEFTPESLATEGRR